MPTAPKGKPLLDRQGRTSSVWVTFWSRTEHQANKDRPNGYAGLDDSRKLDGTEQRYGNTANTACEGNDARLSDARTPLAHAVTHKSGGTDVLKLDELAAPTDVATLNASTTAHGLLRKLSNNNAQFLDGTGAWSAAGVSGTFLSGDSPAKTVTVVNGLITSIV